jgi:predicted AlkP superfamily pyrophosphatase or phosphodiesterase
MLTNSVIAGGVAAGYLTVVVLQVNPQYPVSVSTMIPLVLMLGAAYGLNLTAIFYALIVLRQILAVEVLSPGWLSVRLMSWLFTIAATGGASVMWLNLRGFGQVLDVETARRMAAGAIVVTAAGAVFLMIALAHINRRGGRPSATILVVTALTSVFMPIVLRGPSREQPVRSRVAVPASAEAPPGGRMVMVMLDGASLDVIAPAVAEGRLPNFGRILDGGAVLHVATLRPTQAEPVWTAVATGRTPMQTGVRSSASYRVLGVTPPISLLPDYCFAQALVRFGFLWEEPHTVEDLTARPLWQILSDQGVSVGVIGWPLTHPSAPVHGYLVSDRFHRMHGAELDIDGTSAIWPPSALEVAKASLAVPPDPDPVSVLSVAGTPPSGDYDIASDPEPVSADRVHATLLDAFAALEPRFVAVRFPGVDAVGHYFLRYANPSPFGDVSDAERRRYGRVLEQYYAFLDTHVGRLINGLGPEDVVFVVSGFGMEPMTPSKRVLERLVGNAQISGSHERAPDGFLLAYGTPVQPGRLARASILDVTPTLLYFFGLPVGRDMDGFARTEIFRPSFTSERPVSYIPSYGR